MENIKVSVDKGVATIIVDLKKVLRDSKSGKNQIIATTGGNLEIPGSGGIKMGLNIYKAK